jgi:hypothetical protein
MQHWSWAIIIIVIIIIVMVIIITFWNLSARSPNNLAELVNGSPPVSPENQSVVGIVSVLVFITIIVVLLLIVYYFNLPVYWEPHITV